MALSASNPHRHPRAGGLVGNRDRIKWSMIRSITVATPPNRCHYRQLVAEVTLPKAYLGSVAALAAAYRQWQLPTP